MVSMVEDRTYTLSDLAKAKSMSPNGVRYWLKKYGFDYSLSVGGKILLTSAQFEAFSNMRNEILSKSRRGKRAEG
jgi:hypothetical protein